MPPFLTPLAGARPFPRIGAGRRGSPTLYLSGLPTDDASFQDGELAVWDGSTFVGQDIDPLAGASSPVTTMGRWGLSNPSMTTGAVRAARAICTKAGTYSQIRFAVVSAQTPAPATMEWRLGVWDEAGAVVAQTASQLTVPTAATIYTLALDTPVVLALGQVVYLGVGNVHTGGGGNLNFAGLNNQFAVTGVTPAYSRVAGAYAGGPMGVLTAGTSGTLPWVELVA